MGLFNDNVRPERTEWQYEYTGAELLPYAKYLLTWHAAREQEARDKTADLLRDASVSQNDSRFNELKQKITGHGTVKEQCDVFVYQFSREPERKFKLGLGDVTFFGLTKPVPNT
jgi:hypothetical protein